MKKIAILLFALCSCINAATQITGTLTSPVGGAATGMLLLSAPVGVSLSTACGGAGGNSFNPPVVRITVTNGVLGAKDKERS